MAHLLGEVCSRGAVISGVADLGIDEGTAIQVSDIGFESVFRGLDPGEGVEELVPRLKSVA